MTATISSPVSEPPREWLWTIERYHEAIRLGFLTEDDQVELLFGKLIEKMPVGKIHAATVDKINEYFRDRFGKEFQYREEKPITLPNASEPEPDYTIAYRRDDYYASGHPTPPDILILIEVSDATLADDRTTKAFAYAQAGIKEYWIVNLKSRKLELHLDPLPEEGIYSRISHHGTEEAFKSPFAGEVRVDDLMVEPPEDQKVEEKTAG